MSLCWNFSVNFIKFQHVEVEGLSRPIAAIMSVGSHPQAVIPPPLRCAEVWLLCLKSSLFSLRQFSFPSSSCCCLLASIWKLQVLLHKDGMHFGRSQSTKCKYLRAVQESKWMFQKSSPESVGRRLCFFGRNSTNMTLIDISNSRANFSFQWKIAGDFCRKELVESLSTEINLSPYVHFQKEDRRVHEGMIKLGMGLIDGKVAFMSVRSAVREKAWMECFPNANCNQRSPGYNWKRNFVQCSCHEFLKWTHHFICQLMHERLVNLCSGWERKHVFLVLLAVFGFGKICVFLCFLCFLCFFFPQRFLDFWWKDCISFLTMKKLLLFPWNQKNLSILVHFMHFFGQQTAYFYAQWEIFSCGTEITF